MTVPPTDDAPIDTGSTADTRPSEIADTSPTADTADPCVPPAGTKGREARTLTTDDGLRQYWLFVPDDLEDCTPRPLVLGLHGYFGSGAGFARSTADLLGELARTQTIGVFPDGLAAGDSGYPSFVTSFNDLTSRFDDGPDGPTCTPSAYDYVAYPGCGPDEVDRVCRWGTSCADDVAFVTLALDTVQAEVPVDPDGILLTGFSQGGQTVAGLATALADRISVVAPVHGFAANGHTSAPATAMSMFAVYGTADRVVDATGVPSSDGMIYDGALETAAIWAEAQGCAVDATPYPTVSDGIGGWSCLEHAGCTTSARVVVCSWSGGHVWGGATWPALWAFFEAR